jgi:hypothetical protein
MVSLEGVPYSSLKTAFMFRIRYDAQCQCRAQPWEEAAMNRHKLFAAAEAAKTGDQSAIAEALRLGDKVSEDNRARIAARETAEKSAESELTKLSQTASLAPPERSPKRRSTAPSHPEARVVRLGALNSDPPRNDRPEKGGFKPASGPARNWMDRAFGAD